MINEYVYVVIKRKRKLWLYLQKSGKRITRSMRDTYRSLCKDVKVAISTDRVTSLEIEATENLQAKPI